MESPPPKKMSRAAHFSPRPTRGCKKTFDPATASTEVILQERNISLWASPEATPGKISAKKPVSAFKCSTSVEEWQKRQAQGNVATEDLLLNSTGGLPFNERKNAWMAWSGASGARQAHAADHYTNLRARWSAFKDLQPPASENCCGYDDDDDNTPGGGSDARAVEEAAALELQDDAHMLKAFRASLVVISRDLRRTCQEHSYFSEADGLECLERVLACLLLHDQSVSYTQGMNYIAAFLLLTLQLGDNDDHKEGAASRSAGENTAPPSHTGKEEVGGDAFLGTGHMTSLECEEHVFWLLNSVLTQFQGYFSDGFPDLMRDTQLLNGMVTKLPNGGSNSSGHSTSTSSISESSSSSTSSSRSTSTSGGSSSSSSTSTVGALKTHLDAVGMDLLMYTPKWFICLYLNTVPGHVAVRIWDLAFWHGGGGGGGGGGGNAGGGGGNAVLLWVSLSLLHGLTPKLLGSKDFEGVAGSLTKGMDKLQSFSWLRRHSPFSLNHILSQVKKQQQQQQQQQQQRECKEGSPSSPSSASSLSSSSERNPAASTSSPSSASMPSLPPQRRPLPPPPPDQWFLTCPNERSLVVELASAVAHSAGTLRKADEAQVHKDMTELANKEAKHRKNLLASQAAAVSTACTLNENTAGDSRRLLTAKGEEEDDDAILVLDGRSSFAVVQEEGKTPMLLFSTTTTTPCFSSPLSTTEEPSSSSKANPPPALLLLRFDGGTSDAEAIEAAVASSNLHYRPIPDALRLLLALIPATSSTATTTTTAAAVTTRTATATTAATFAAASAESAVPSPPVFGDALAGCSGEAARSILGAFAAAYTALQRANPSAAVAASREAQQQQKQQVGARSTKTSALLSSSSFSSASSASSSMSSAAEASSSSLTLSSYDPMGAEAAFVLSCACLLLSANLHHRHHHRLHHHQGDVTSSTPSKQTAAAVTAAIAVANGSTLLSEESFVKQVGLALSRSPASNLTRTAVAAAHRSVSATPILASSDSKHTSTSSSSSATIGGFDYDVSAAIGQGFESAMGKLATFFPPSTTKHPPPPQTRLTEVSADLQSKEKEVEAGSGSNGGSRFALRTLFTGTPRKQLSAAISSSATVLAPSTTASSSPTNNSTLNKLKRCRSDISDDDEAEEEEGGNGGGGAKRRFSAEGVNGTDDNGRGGLPETEAALMAMMEAPRSARRSRQQDDATTVHPSADLYGLLNNGEGGEGGGGGGGGGAAAAIEPLPFQALSPGFRGSGQSSSSSSSSSGRVMSQRKQQNSQKPLFSIGSPEAIEMKPTPRKARISPRRSTGSARKTSQEAPHLRSPG